MCKIIKMKVVFYFSNYDLFVTYGQSTNFKVTLDAGHGGHDFGAVYNGHVEKT
jgi:N-acetylmuramoyl-L-alanine amidase